MVLRRVLTTVVAGAFLPLAAMTWFESAAAAQDLSETVFPITQLKLLGPGAEFKFATGFCLSEDCRFVGTNYHVAMMTHLRKINGDKVIHSYLATGPDDDGASINDASSANSMKYNLGRDIAIYELRYPLPHYHGIPFSLIELQLGQEVDIYAYPKESISPIRGLFKFHGVFRGETTGGLLAFDYTPSNGKSIRPGASGGLVLDSKSQQIVGILSGVAQDGETVAMAVPTESLANFVNKVEPWLAQSLFPSTNKESISPGSADLYPKFVLVSPADSPQGRRNEPPEIKTLRNKAKQQAENMRNIVAVQSLAWGSGDKTPVAVAEYEVKILQGFQRFREYPDGKRELQNVPFPPVNNAVVPGGEWSELPQMIGTALRLKIRQASSAAVNGHPVKVFQYQASSEDGACIFKSVTDLVFGSRSKIISASCYGEVWTDADLNILRASLHLELPGRWRDYVSVVTYGWLRPAEEGPRLIPLTISTQAEFKKKVYWCRGLFTNYRIFTIRSRIASADYVQSLPR